LIGALGYVACIDRSQEKVVFPAHEKQVLFIKRLRKQDVLVTVGIDEDMPCAASIKLWKMSNIDSGEPQLARTIKPFDNKFLEAPITCFDATDDLSQIILGLGDGGLLIIEGDLLRSNKSINQKYLRKPGGPCITSVHFVEETRESLFKTYCYVSTTRTVFSVITQMNSKGFGPSGGPQPELELDPEEGCELNCSTLTDSKMIAVARDQAVYCFMRADRGPGYFFEEPKKLIRWYNNHLILVSEDRKQPGKNTINIYDLANQLIAFNGKFENVVDVVYEWATLFVISKSGQMVRLLEKDLSKKIDMLFKRNLYSVAINLARAQKLSNRDVAEIYKKYGDHLYEKGDYDRAMEQYIETIKEGKTYVEPSYIIRNFLDSQRIDNLAIYLEALHANKCANKDHTTLLLNCFTKSKDISKLDRFIQESFEHERKSKEGPNFDIDTAIQVCRQAGYFNHALLMAKQHSKNHMYAKILVEDLKQFSAAIESVYEMNIIDAEHVLKQYGQEMMLQDPDATTKLLKTICTEFRGSDKRQSISSSKSRSKASEFIYVFVGNSTYLENFLEHIIEKFPGSDSALYNSLL
jgi:tetratricopeptide (TPR) repeat protein